MRLLHSADWHLGAPSAHPIYSKQAVPALVNAAREHGAEYILVAGDVFDRPHPNQVVKDYLLEQLIAAEDITFIFSVGNHDYTTKAKEYHSLQYLEILSGKLSNVSVVGPNKAYMDDELIVFAVDQWEDLLNIDATLTKLKNHDLDNLYKIGVWHGIVPGIDIRTLNTKNRTLGKQIKKVLRHLDYIALGDIHKRLSLDPHCRYSGALYQKTYADEAGVVLVSDVGTPGYLDLGLPRRVTAEVDISGEYSEEDLVDNLRSFGNEGDLLKVKFQLPASVWTPLDKQYIRNELLGTYAEVKLDNDLVPERDRRKNLDKIEKANTIMDEIAAVIEAEDFGVDDDRLLEFCAEIVERI